jgi:hypothetical protein
MRTLKLLAAAAIFPALSPAVATSEAGARSLFQSHFASVQGGTPCYARTYGAGHLQAHPDQRVTDIEIDMAKTDPDGNAITEDAIQLGFGLRVIGSAEWYMNVAICKSEGEAIECFLDGDGGRFSLSAADGGALQLKTGDYGIVIEGSKDVVELPGNKGDDRVFVLKPADPKACEDASAAGPE